MTRRKKLAADTASNKSSKATNILCNVLFESRMDKIVVSLPMRAHPGMPVISPGLHR